MLRFGAGGRRQSISTAGARSFEGARAAAKLLLLSIEGTDRQTDTRTP